METNSFLDKNKRLVGIVLAIAIMLLVPLVAMQFTDEVQWDAADFIIMGTLLLGFGLVYEYVARRVRSTKYRILLGLATLAVVGAIWVELAVGIFD